jgi:sigma-B regulation protein RsbU (phosphoserine phosphatase)
MERDLDMARQVQLRLLPSAPPPHAHAEIAASFIPARSIGGDLYDFLDYGPAPLPDLEDPDEAAKVAFTIPSSRTLIVIGDVSGKAAPAALYAALVSGIIRSLAPRHLPPARMLSMLNDQLQERKLDGQYVTMLIALWDDSTRTLLLANAGSVQPLLVTRGRTPTDGVEVKTIKAEGFPLGLFPNVSYDELVVRMSPGDLVVFFSDGITDAINSRGEDFGTERLARLLRQHPTAASGARSAVKAILEAVSIHQGGAEHFDDETVVVIGVS